MKNQKVLGIDDCDFLLSASTPDGNDSLYLRLMEHDKGYFGEMTYDLDTAHACFTGEKDLHFNTLEEAARWLINRGNEWAADNDTTVYFDSTTQKLRG